MAAGVADPERLRQVSIVNRRTRIHLIEAQMTPESASSTVTIEAEASKANYSHPRFSSRIYIQKALQCASSKVDA